MENEKIKHAAIVRSDGILEIAKSHPEIIKRCPYGTCKEGSKMGFVTSTGRYVDRIEALKIAIEADQINKDMDTIRQSGLISENIWADTDHKYDPEKGYYIPEKKYITRVNRVKYFILKKIFRIEEIEEIEELDPDEWTMIIKIDQLWKKRLLFKIFRIEEFYCRKEVRLVVEGEERTTTAFEYLKFIKKYGHIPSSTEKPCAKPSNSEIKRWLKKGSVVINGEKPGINDIVKLPITELVFFPKGKSKTTMI